MLPHPGQGACGASPQVLQQRVPSQRPGHRLLTAGTTAGPYARCQARQLLRRSNDICVRKLSKG